MYKRIIAAVLACLVGVIGAAGTANAGSFSNGLVTVTWRDEALVHPGDDWRACTRVTFSVVGDQPKLWTLVKFDDAVNLATIPDSDVTKNFKTTTSAGFEADEGLHTVNFCNVNKYQEPVDLSNLLMTIESRYFDDRFDSPTIAQTPFSLRPASEFATAAPTPTAQPKLKRGVKCERISPYKIKKFKKRYKCPKGWVRI